MQRIKSPVYEVGFAIQHAMLEGITVRDVGEAHELYSDEFPFFQQADLAAPMPMPLAQPSGVVAGQMSIPRLWFLSSDGKTIVQMQQDRIAFNWRRLSSPSQEADYPGYEDLKGSFERHFAKGREWARARSFGSVSPSVGELFYLNAIPIMDGGKQRRLSDILAFYRPTEPVRVFGFNIGWNEIVDENFPSTLTVTIQGSVAMDGEQTLNLTLLGQFGLEDVSDEEVSRRFDVVHSYIHDVLPRLLTSQILEGFA